MERRLRGYLWWKGRLNTEEKSKSKTKCGNSASSAGKINPGESSSTSGGTAADGLSEALRRKDAMKAQRGLNRRRIRGGGSTTASRANSVAPEGSTPAPAVPSVLGIETVDAGGMSAKEREKFGILSGEGEMRIEADDIADL